MSREERLKKFLDSVDAKFKAHNTEESFKNSMTKIDEYKTEKARSGKARQDAASQFRIKFDALPSMPLSQTKVEQAKFPELATDWGEQTVGFVSNLAAKARTLAIEKSDVEKELNESMARVIELEKEIASKQTKSVGELQNKVNELTKENGSLTAENANTKTEISALNQKMDGLMAQIAGHNAELQIMNGMLTENQGKLDVATSANKELGAQLETAEKGIAVQKLANESLSEQLETMNIKFGELSSTNATLLSDLETKKTVESDNDALKARIAEIEGLLLSKEVNIVSIQAEMDNKIKQIENQYKMENAKAKIFHDMEKDLMKQLHDAAIEKQISEIAKNSLSSTAELVAQISALEQEHKNAVEAVKSELEANKATLSELTDSQAIFSANTNAEKEELKEAKQLCDEKMVELEEVKQACDREKAACEEAKLALETTNKELEAANIDCENQRKQLEAANAECEKQREKLQEANAAIEGALIANNARIKEIDEQIKNLNAEKFILQQINTEQANNHAEQIAALKEEKIGIEQQNANLNQTLTSLSAEHETLKTKLNDLEQTYQQSTKELLDANAAELQTLIAEHKEKISEAEKKEKESITKFAIDACLINNSIESLKWNNWESAKGYFVGKYGNVDKIVGLQSIIGLSDQIKSIDASTTLDGLMKSFGMLKPIFSPYSNNSSQPTSVEPTCIESLTKLTIAFLNSQKQIEDIRNEIAKKEEIERIENEEYESLLSDQTNAVKILEELTDKVGILEGKIEATKGENLDLSAEKEELKKQLNDLQIQLNNNNEKLSVEEKDKMNNLIDANATIQGLTEQLNKIKEELEIKEKSLEMANKNEELRKTQFDELTAKIETQKSTVSKLKGEVAENNELKVGLTLRIQEVDNINKLLTAQLKALETQNEEILKYAASDLDELETENNNLQEQIYAKKLELDALTSANNANKEEIDTLASDKAANKAKIEELTSTNEANQEKMQTLSQIINAFTGDLTKNKTEIERLKDELNVKTQILMEIEKQLQDLLNNKSEMEKALFNLQSVNDMQKLEHDQAIIKAKKDYENALALAKAEAEAEAGTASKIDLDRQLEEAKVELDRQLLEAKAELDKQLEEAKAELKIKLADEANANLERQLEEAKTECDQKIQELQNRELKLAKELLFLKLQLDLKTQQASNYKPVYVPPSTTTTYVPSTPTFVKKDRIAPRQKIDLKGGANNKSKIFMKGGAYSLVDYDDNTELVVVFDKTDYSTIGQYPVPANDDDYVVHCTEKEIKDYNNRTQELKTEIESLKKELENLKNSASTSTTPICAFVNKMAHGASTSASTMTNAKLMKELMLIKTHISSNANKFLLERIANMTNQKIVSTLNNASKKKIADLTATIDTNKATITDMEAKIATNETTITDMEGKIATNETTITGMEAEIATLKSTVSSSSGSGGGPIGIGSGPIGIGGSSGSGPSGGSGSGPSTGAGAGPSGGIGVTNTLAGYVKPNIAFVPGN